jgi:chaperonin cofactor prefoldin
MKFYIYFYELLHIYNLQNELKNLEDAFDELVLMDDDVKIPFYIGEIFVHQSLETTQVIKYNII